MPTPSTLALKAAMAVFNDLPSFESWEDAQRECRQNKILCVLTDEGRAESLENGKRDIALQNRYGKPEKFVVITQKVYDLARVVCSDETFRESLMDDALQGIDSLTMISMPCSRDSLLLSVLASEFLPNENDEVDFYLTFRDSLDREETDRFRLIISKYPKQVGLFDPPGNWDIDRGPFRISEKVVRFFKEFGASLKHNEEMMPSSLK